MKKSWPRKVPPSESRLRSTFVQHRFCHRILMSSTPEPTTEQSIRHEHKTPTNASVQALKKYAGDKLSNNDIFRRTGVAPRTGRRWLADQTNPRRSGKERPGRNRKISDENIQKIIDSFQGKYHNRVLKFEEICQRWNLDCHPRTLKNALANRGYHKCRAKR
jgi:transposase